MARVLVRVLVPVRVPGQVTAPAPGREPARATALPKESWETSIRLRMRKQAARQAQLQR